MRRGLIGYLQRLLRGAGRPAPSRRAPRRTGTTDLRGGGYRFEYSPVLDGDPDPGEIVWTWVPYEDDPTKGKDRPVAVIGRRGDHLVGVALTSKERDPRYQVPVGTGSWDRERRPSFAKVDRVLDIDPGSVRREGAVLTRAQYDAVVAGVRRRHDHGS